MSTSSSPIRTPDTSNPQVMTTRGVWLVVLNILIPGSAQALAGNRRLGRIGLTSTLIGWFFIILLLIINALWKTALISIFALPFFLVLAQIALVYFAILWIVLTIDTLRLVKIIKTGPRARYWLPAVSLVALLGMAGGMFFASNVARSVTGLVSDIGIAGPAVEPVDGRYNFLVMGVDSDPERLASGMGARPDTVQVLSIDANTGKILSFGFPRDMHNIPFPKTSPMYEIYPNGYTESAAEYCSEWACLNTVYVDAELNHADLYPEAKKAGVSAGIYAMMDAAEGMTGLKMQFYAVVNMTGLQNLIDALGGVDIYVKEPVALANMGVPDSEVKAWIRMGNQHLDGWHALMYARSRHSATGDYDRMNRQQNLMQALQKQMNPMNVLSKFQEISKAGGQVLNTNIPQPMFGTLADLAMKSRTAGYSGYSFTPYGSRIKIYPHDPDYRRIKEFIQLLIHPPTPTPTPSN
ncbi:MAG: Biofilm regulatory protein precursor [Actinomycetota bacterium]